MKSIAVITLTLTLASTLALPLTSDSARAADAQTPPAAPASCAPAGGLKFICGLTNVEDFLPVDNGRWLVGGSLLVGSAGLYLIDTTAKTAKSVALSIASKPDPLYTGCGAPDLKGLSTHGLDVDKGHGGITTVYAVNHGGRESIEIFRLNAGKAAAEWIGCVVLPEGANGNSIALLPNGAFAVSKFLDTADKKAFEHILAGQINGVVYLWTPGKGFSEVPGTRLSGDNGLAASADGKWLYVNAYGTKEIYRVPLTGKDPIASVKVDFAPDNLRWAPDGKLFVTGQFLTAQNQSGRHGWATVRLDPQAMTTTPVIKNDGMHFDDATSLVQIGQTQWFATFRGDRVAYRTVQ